MTSFADKTYVRTIVAPVGELSCLTYFSSATERFSQIELKKLLEISRRNNPPLGITGLLLYRDGHFLQYLEGPADAVEDVYNRISRDRRHELPQIVGAGQIQTRIFPEWSMGYKNLAGLRADNTEGYSECLLQTFQPSGDGDPEQRLMDLFYELVARSSSIK